MRRRSTVLTAALVLLVVAGAQAQMGPRRRPLSGQPPFAPGGSAARVPFVDTHVHLDGQAPNLLDWEGAVQVALGGMDALGVTRSLVMPPPFPAGLSRAYDHEAFVAAVSGHPDKLGFPSGGGSLNGMIQEALAAGEASQALRRRFEERAEKVLKDGAFGFGELTAEHLSFNSRHPHLSAPPDHPLFLALADIAARHDVPIDLHMEAVPQDMPLPPRFASPPNPPTLKENVSGLERLLAHNARAKVVWAHVGWDNTGHWTPERCRRLLTAHPNLYFSIKIDQLSLPDSRPMTPSGIKPEWLELFTTFPDRFYSSPRFPLQRAPVGQAIRAFLDRLPPDLARTIATDNAVRIYNLAQHQ